MNKYPLHEKIIVVTGGSGLLGKAMINDITSKGGKALNLDIDIKTDFDSGNIYCDITDDDSIIKVINEIASYFGRIDGLINNAYPRTTDWGTPFEDIKPESWRKNIDWQLNSYFLITQQVLKKMKTQQNGSIINIASIYGVVGNDFGIYEGTTIIPPAAYSAIKGGLINFTRYLASLYGKWGIRINSLSPGGIFDHQDPIFVKAYEAKVPLKRMGTPGDIAPAASFLLSDEAGYITGHNLIIDGGWTSI